MAIPGWLEAATDGRTIRRALATAVAVGTLLTILNHGSALASGSVTQELAWQVALSFLVPFLVSTLAGALALRTRAPTGQADYQLLEREIEAINKFPGRNPNPVLRMTPDGVLIYANDASEPIRDAIGAVVNQPLPRDLAEGLLRSSRSEAPTPVSITAGLRTFEILAVYVPELDVVNLYGTDVTGARVVARFPDRNPFPVLRQAKDGSLLYANQASEPITRALHLTIGETIPEELAGRLREAADRTAEAGLAGLEGYKPIEVAADGRTFELTPVAIPEFEFVNIYGMDVTATKTVTKFPDQNPNPVLRFSRDGRLIYVNAAGEPVRRALGVRVGDSLPVGLREQVRDLAAREEIERMEVEDDGQVFSLLIVPVYEFGFINVYGTDITAARMVEQANRENERLLLNILPASIVGRLRSGEMVIADRIDEITVLFADVVGFTQIAARLSATEVITMLNGIFSAFDQMVERQGLEKIKTIGDAYMVCGGLTADETDHGVRVAEMGLEMLEYVKRYENELTGPIQLRIGLNVGPAVAGVIGIKKFIYDIWGDTVNTASRMESHGVPGRIQVTADTARRLSGSYRFERRGEVDVKGKGRLETFFLVDRQPSQPARGTTAEPTLAPADRS
jgi:class 3 adenylate cyclase